MYVSIVHKQCIVFVHLLSYLYMRLKFCPTLQSPNDILYYAPNFFRYMSGFCAKSLSLCTFHINQNPETFLHASYTYNIV